MSACVPCVPPDQLGLDGFEERFNDSIVITIALAAHPLPGSALQSNVSRGAIRVVDAVFRRRTERHSHVQRSDRKVAIHTIAYCPTDDAPFYSISIDDKDLVTFRPRKEAKPLGVYDLIVHMKTHEKAHKHAGGWDTFVLEGKWREWLLDSGFIPDSVEASFMAFFKKYVENNGTA